MPRLPMVQTWPVGILDCRWVFFLSEMPFFKEHIHTMGDEKRHIIHGKRMGCIIINHVMFSSKMFQLTFPLINAHGTSRDYMQTCVKIGAPYNGWSIHKISPSLWLIWALRTKCVYVPYGFPVGYCSILGFHIILCEIWVVLILNY